MFDVTSSVPVVIVNALEIPSTELADKANEVPLIVTLKRLVVPFNVDVPVNVAIPALAENVPLTSSDFEIEKPDDAVTEPVICKELNKIVPPPPIVFVVPFISTLPGLILVKEPAIEIFPVTTIEEDELIDPGIVTFSKVMPVPVIFLVVPVMLNVLPAWCVNVPGLVVDRSPATAILLVAVILLPEIFRL